MGTPTTGLPSFPLKVSQLTIYGGEEQRKKKKKMDLSCSPPHTPFLKNIKVDLYCQLLCQDFEICSSMSCCVLHSPIYTLTYMHTQAAPTSDLETTCSLPFLRKSKAPQPFISAPTPWALLLSIKLCSTSRVLHLKPLNSLMFGKSWESSSREGTT